ncbi:TetR/AcrR family transcriptional regulator [Paenibacillus tritici]|uniref:TetR/AcrR family transcriptional regulator n=1 Tax=Paenibacillus tritici TaxID=1873425 RepID=A0ABX2DI83_9BACL|nr:TetR/AcrR family transcriptional regulator [Paenibacillus tritici]NQX44185.1 TetR/AcrR family transcriptional regulator [Paenibacillus tritici]QUL57811.1 TetR/AcrR family transcriptional regulator [Paenibacillus tritici]
MGKRNDILQATLDLITEEGLQSVTFAKIFKRANVGSSTFYHYFENKEQLVNELYHNIRIHKSEFIMNGYNPGLTIYERVKSILKNSANYSLQYPKEVEFTENYCSSPYISEILRNTPDPPTLEIISIIEEGQRQGIIREMNITLCCQLISGILSAVIKGYLNGKYPLNEHQIQQTIESCWLAIKV